MRDRRGNTALHLACLNGYKECVKQLLTPLDLFEKNRSPGTDNLPQDLEMWNYDGKLKFYYYLFRLHPLRDICRTCFIVCIDYCIHGTRI